MSIHRNIRPGSALLILLSLVLAHGASAHAACALQTLAPKGSEVQIKSTTINLGEADDPVHPTAWQGPLTAGDCKIDLNIIERPIKADKSGRYLYVPTYSGSLRKLTLVDLQSCATPWTSEAFSGTLKISSKQLILGKTHVALDAACLPGKVSQR